MSKSDQYAWQNISVEHLFNECSKSDPDLTKIEEYVKKCRCKSKISMLDDKWQGGFTPLRLGGFTPLQVACRYGHHKIVDILLDCNNNFSFSVNVNEINYDHDNKTALHFACENNFPLAVISLLQHPNIDVNKSNTSNQSPMFDACCNNRKAVVWELLKHPDIQLTTKEEYGRIPLHFACLSICKDTDIIEMLISHRQHKYRILQLNAIGDSHQTPLHAACRLRHTSAVANLLDRVNFLNMNATDIDGNTPLHIACNYCLSLCIFDPTIIKILLEQPSVIIDIKNNNNKTPLDIIKNIMNMTNRNTKQHFIDIIQLHEDCLILKRWRVYCFILSNCVE